MFCVAVYRTGRWQQRTHLSQLINEVCWCGPFYAPPILPSSPPVPMMPCVYSHYSSSMWRDEKGWKWILKSCRASNGIHRIAILWLTRIHFHENAVDWFSSLFVVVLQLQAIVSFALSMPVLSHFHETLLSPLAVQWSCLVFFYEIDLTACRGVILQ